MTSRDVSRCVLGMGIGSLPIIAPTLALAQLDPAGEFPGGGLGLGSSSGGSTPYLLLQVLAAFLIWTAIFALAFFVWFPRRLEQSGANRPRPREAYWSVWAWVFALWSLSLLGLFWKQLVLDQIFTLDRNVVPAVVNHWSLKIALVLVAVVSFLATTSYSRSSQGTAQIK